VFAAAVSSDECGSRRRKNDAMDKQNIDVLQQVLVIVKLYKCQQQKSACCFVEVELCDTIIGYWVGCVLCVQNLNLFLHFRSKT
jgi:hypothetical protein